MGLFHDELGYRAVLVCVLSHFIPNIIFTFGVIIPCKTNLFYFPPIQIFVVFCICITSNSRYEISFKKKDCSPTLPSPLEKFCFIASKTMKHLQIQAKTSYRRKHSLTSYVLLYPLHI